MLQFDDTPVTRQGPVQWAMINNDVLRSVRYSLDLGDHHVVTLCQMADPAFVVDTEQVQDRCVQVMHMHSILDGKHSQFVAGTIHQSAFHTATGEDCGEC